MIYVVQAVSGGPVKIGYTQDEARLRTRLSTLQIGNPKKLRVIATATGAGPMSEARLHTVFNRHWIRGEWFRYAKGVERFVNACNDDNDLDVITWCVEYEEAVARLLKRHRRS